MLKRIAVMAAALLLCLGILIGWFGHSTSPTVEKWRTIWIETAMTTGSHQWLATLFFPREAVDAAIAGRYHGEGVIGGEDTNTRERVKTTYLIHPKRFLGCFGTL